MSAYYGDYHLGDTVNFNFTTTSASTGAPTTLSGTPALSAYIGSSTTQLTAGITLTVDFDSVTGMNHVTIVASSGNGYTAATDVDIVITTGTVGGTSAVGYIVGSFSIDNRTANVARWLGTAVTAATAGIPDTNAKNINNVSTSSVTTINANQGTTQPLNFTGTAGSALVKSDMVDVAGSAVSTSTAQLGVNVVNFGGSAGTFASGRPEVNTTHLKGTSSAGTAGYVGLDWSTINAPTTSQTLSGTTIGTASSVTAVASGGITRASLAADTGLQPIRSNTAQAGAATTITLDASASASNNFYNNCLILLTGGTGVGQARFITAYVGATKVATVATWVTNPDNTTTFAILPFDAVAGASAPTAAQIATAVWQDTTSSDFTVASSIGKSLYTSGNAPGAASGLALVGSNMGTVSSVTGNVGGNVVGSVASVTARVTANTDQLAGQTVSAAAGVTFPSSVASPTNITAGTITTVTNLTNAPTAGDFTTTMKTSLNAATPAVTVSDKTGFALTAAYDAAKTAAQAGDVMKVSSGTGANQIDLTSGKVNLGKINGTTVNGDGGVTPWGP